MKKTLKILLLTLFLIFAISMLSNVKGASASIKASKNPASVGDNVTINININAASWNLKASGTGVKGGTYVGFTPNLNNESKTEKLTLDTSTTGSKTIILSGDITDESGATTQVNTSVTVVVNEKKQTNNNSKASDTTLSSVTIDGENYKLNSTKTVPADKTSVVIKATTSNSKAKVAGTGTKELMPGTNKFTLTVTAENGTKRNVAVTIFREEGTASTPEPTPTPDENAELRLTSLEVVGAVLSPFFDEGIFEYTTSVVNLDLVQVNAIANIEDADIEIIGNTDLIEGENVITIKLTKDERETEYQITVTKIAEVVSNPDDKQEENESFFGSTKGKMVLGLVIVVLIIAIIIVIFKIKSDDDDYDKPSRRSRKEAKRRASYDDFD